MHLLFFHAKFVLFAQNINLEKKLTLIMKIFMRSDLHLSQKRDRWHAMMATVNELPRNKRAV